MSRVVVITLASLLLVGLIGAVAFGFVSTWTRSDDGEKKGMEATTKAVQAMCQPTDYKEACFKSLSGVHTDEPKELIRKAFESAKLELANVAQNSTVLKDLERNPATTEAVKNCKELFEDAIDDLQRSFDEIGKMEWNLAEKMVGNLKSWLSAAITYQDTCIDGFDNTTGDAADKVRKLLETSRQMSSNGLAIISDMSLMLGDLEPSSLNRRRLLEVKSQRKLLGSIYEHVLGHDNDGILPFWLEGSRRRRLLEASTNLGAGDLKSKANVVVAKDGSGKYKTIGEALQDIPKHGHDSFIVYIKQGVYDEYLVLERWMTHVVFVGDGPNKTRITHNKNFVDGTKTFKSATLSVLGDYFMAKDIGVENTAGASKRQAVALRVQSDESIFYNVHVDGYQDTLYALTYRQFYRDCRISGTIDFIFGDAAAFFQNCTFVVRKPLEDQKCIITAQGRMERHQSTGIIIHKSRIEADSEYYPNRQKNKAYLGRPSKEYSRTIIMETHIGDFIQPEGWIPWKDNYGLETCYYSEFNNKGPGSKLDNRVKWKGIKTINDQRAVKFMPLKFFEADDWIQDSGVPYEPKLSASPPAMTPQSGHDDSKDEDTTTSSSSTEAPTSSTTSSSSTETPTSSPSSSSSTEAPTSSPSSGPSPSSDDQDQSADDTTGSSPTPSPSDSSDGESGSSPSPSPSPSPGADERELSEIRTGHDLDRMLTADEEQVGDDNYHKPKPSDNMVQTQPINC